MSNRTIQDQWLYGLLRKGMDVPVGKMCGNKVLPEAPVPAGMVIAALGPD